MPLDFDGQAFLIEHRKLGLGVFAHNPKKEEDAAEEIVVRIHIVVKVARPFFDWLAEQAVHHSVTLTLSITVPICLNDIDIS